MSKPLVEIACFNLESALTAARQGVQRIELCDNFAEGGTTPSMGTFKILRQQYSGQIAVMIRPRGGDFTHTMHERIAMAEDVRLFREAGADLLVFGALRADGTVDEEACEQWIAAAGTIPCTFHRAFDACRDPFTSLETLIAIGFSRVLTSGQKENALAGAAMLGALVSHASGRIKILAGGGIRAENLADILALSGVKEVHASARHYTAPVIDYQDTPVQFNSALPEDWRCVLGTDPVALNALLKIADQL